MQDLFERWCYASLSLCVYVCVLLDKIFNCSLLFNQQYMCNFRNDLNRAAECFGSWYPSVWFLHIPYAWMVSLPQSKDIYVRLTGDSKFLIGVIVSVTCCLSFCVWTATDWQRGQDTPCFSSYQSWDWPNPTVTLPEQKWMDGLIIWILNLRHQINYKSRWESMTKNIFCNNQV